jgi:hypothetical protein
MTTPRTRHRRRPPLQPHLKEAFQRRQRDTGWGYALAYSTVPLAAFYHAWNRRTITPMLCGLTANLLAGLLVLAGLVAIGKRQESVASLLVMNLAVMAPTVLATKYGIDSCRTYAKRRLDAEG